MPSLDLATQILEQVVVPGEAFDLSFGVKNSGSTFNLTGYTPKARLRVGSVTVTVSCTVVTPIAGLASASWTAAQTATLPAAQWGTITLWADPDATSENLFIATIPCRTSAEVLP